MADAVIDNPILNSPYDEPNRHFRFDEQGITSEVVAGRRSSGYFVPIPAARKNSPQLSLATEWTSDRLTGRDRRGRVGVVVPDTVTRFPRPDTGKIAIKVINHYGDEVLKVYPV